mmetsp:Transcript_19851/g.35407  ORF Transcript_19851/g.35407 Transcript_19851/m.35407 type:complete len:85 (-) Transcript_19851:209-463(-)
MVWLFAKNVGPCAGTSKSHAADDKGVCGSTLIVIRRKGRAIRFLTLPAHQALMVVSSISMPRTNTQCYATAAVLRNQKHEHYPT